jgi:hypothetical protein
MIYQGDIMKLNCWEFKKCGREPGGVNVGELGVCPATTEKRLDGMYGGKNSGRTCWVVAGTYCEGEVQGTFGKKFGNCSKCDFYNLVKEEESPNYTLSINLLEKLKDYKIVSSLSH